MQYVVKHTEHTSGNAGLAQCGDGSLNDPSAEAGGAHDNGGGARHRDDEVNADHVAEAGDDEFNELTLILKADNADDDTHEQEPSCRVIEPPIAETGAGEPGGNWRKRSCTRLRRGCPKE